MEFEICNLKFETCNLEFEICNLEFEIWNLQSEILNCKRTSSQKARMKMLLKHVVSPPAPLNPLKGSARKNLKLIWNPESEI